MARRRRGLWTKKGWKKKRRVVVVVGYCPSFIKVKRESLGRYPISSLFSFQGNPSNKAGCGEQEVIME